jgi:hypothetical protein
VFPAALPAASGIVIVAVDACLRSIISTFIWAIPLHPAKIGAPMMTFWVLPAVTGALPFAVFMTLAQPEIFPALSINMPVIARTNYSILLPRKIAAKMADINAKRYPVTKGELCRRYGP